ncbi:MAG TPA: hypothetical protein VIM31_04680 [Candidatus Microsaccharimonas sp.]|jgi:hypothetical protein
MILSVAYDLHNPGRHYAGVEAALQSASGWCHPQGSVWFIDTTLSPEQWVTKLSSVADSNDEFLVTQVRENWWSKNMDTNAINWFKSSSRNW